VLEAGGLVLFALLAFAELVSADWIAANALWLSRTCTRPGDRGPRGMPETIEGLLAFPKEHPQAPFAG
jgi:hypothetical protein